MAKATSKKLYPKAFIFNKKKSRLKEKKPVELAITEHTVHCEKGAVLFVKDKAVSNADLKLMSQYQIEFYLEEK